MVPTARDPQSIVWIASYPRSGNTFVRLLLANYFVARFAPMSLHSVMDFTFGEGVEFLWHQVTQLKASERSERTQWLARGAYMDRLRNTTPPTPFRFVKTHTVNCTRWSSPAFDFRPADRVIYVARNPLDVAVSLASFFGWPMDKTISHMLSPYASVQNEVTGTWNLHVHSWLQMTGAPLLFVNYNDLVADTAGQLVRILKFLGGKPNLDHVANIVNWTRFEKLQEQENTIGFPEAPKARKFFRAGRADQWKDNLTPEQVTYVINACSAGMDLIGAPRLSEKQYAHSY